MDHKELNIRIRERGEELLRLSQGKGPSVFEKRRWIGKIMGWSLGHDEFRTPMLRFVDAFPSLSTARGLTRHLGEYFNPGDPLLPAPVRFGVRTAGRLGTPGAALLGTVTRLTVGSLAKQFIAGETDPQVVKAFTRVRRSGCAFSVDILGEAVLSEDEADRYCARYMALLGALKAAERKWPPLGVAPGTLDWGYMPRIGISLKPSALYSRTRPLDFEGSVEGIMRRLRPVYEEVIRTGAAMTIDMESYQLKDISLEVYRRLRRAYPTYPNLAIAMQAYLTSTGRDLGDLIVWARKHRLPVAVRLVKGAYWDQEVMRAMQNGWEMPVYTDKAETDAAFERLQRLALGNHDIVYFACASHNIRSLAAVMETAKELGVPDDRYEFQVLYGMAEPIRRALLKAAGRVRLYCPAGPLVPGMGYLVRRLLENTANQGFLRLMFAEKADPDVLLMDPVERGTGEPEGEDHGKPKDTGSRGPTVLPPFGNQPPADFTRKEEREGMANAIALVRQRLGQPCPLYINGVDRITPDTIPSVNPAGKGEVIAHVCQAGKAEAEDAVRAAEAGFRIWREMPPEERASYLLKAAAVFRRRRHELAAWQVLEIGKQWDQADADVAEAIDFLEYYAREMVRLNEAQHLPSPPGEDNRYFYEPRGVAVVIAPWNFPLSISCGMVSAAMVTGNSVVYKPSPLTPVVGRLLVEAFDEARLPHGVLNYIPGRTEVIAEYLIDHPSVSTIAFTGSTTVGLRIIERASVVHPGQNHVKRVIAEMGGKNGIIIDDDADLDEAVPAVLQSAFGFQGQKCSACSRVIVVAPIYDAFVDRLTGAAKALVMGPAEDPVYMVGPVADHDSRKRILSYIDLAREEGKILYQSDTPSDGAYVPVTIVGDVRPGNRVAEEEIFGPVLAVMKAKDFDEALEWANSTRFALTGGVFSRSPRHLEEARRRFRVGNLYLNRHITGAIVGRQPFGGFKLSGLGTKAGGPEYLLHFMDPRVVTENTARRGFTPDL